MTGRCFIVHSTLGVFMGETLGLGFFSMMGDCGRQTHAPVFSSFDAARAFATKFDDPQIAGGFTFFAVPKEYGTDGYVDCIGMKASGVPDDMLRQVLVNEAARAAILRGNAKLH